MYLSNNFIADIYEDFKQIIPGVMASKDHGFVFINDLIKDNWIQIDCS